MAYIARTNGGATVLEMRDGTLADAPIGDRHNWREVIEIGEVNADGLTEQRYIAGLVVAEPVVHLQFQKIRLPEPMARLNLKRHAARKRWEIETGGTVFSGMKIDTSQESQGKIDILQRTLEKGWASSINFKAADGHWYEVYPATADAIAQAVLAHVQACFAAEAAIVEAIDAGTITTRAQIDGYLWPPNA